LSFIHYQYLDGTWRNGLNVTVYSHQLWKCC